MMLCCIGWMQDIVMLCYKGWIQYHCNVTKQTRILPREYPMRVDQCFISRLVSNSVEKRGLGNCVIVPHTATLISMGHGDKCKNPYPLRNHIILNLATARAPENIRPQATWLLGPDSYLIGNYAISQ